MGVWVGCRWLLATNNFADLILNSVALEFILCFKDVLYLALVSRRSMIDLENTTIRPAQRQEPESLRILVGTMSWAFSAGIWVLIFMGFSYGDYHFNGIQQVLRNYKWDVHDVCAD